MTIGGLSSLEFYTNVDDVIARERRDDPLCRQVAVNLLICPSKDGLCVYWPRAAQREGKECWIPPQGEVESGEPLRVAALRELDEELAVTELRLPNPYYLGSIKRHFETNNRKRKTSLFESAHYHWVLALASGYTLMRAPEMVEARWRHAHGLFEVCDAMSPAKATMFKAAVRRAIEGPLCRVPVWRYVNA